MASSALPDASAVAYQASPAKCEPNGKSSKRKKFKPEDVETTYLFSGRPVVVKLAG